MSANERRAEIMRIMVARRQENMQVLAAELGVTDRTIRNDILVLTAEYPLETTRGNGGGVRIADWYHPHKNIFSVPLKISPLNISEIFPLTILSFYSFISG